MKLSEIITQVTPFSLAILLILVLLLFLTLWYMLRKRNVLSTTEKYTKLFLNDFWSGVHVDQLAQTAREGEYGEAGIVRIFLSGHEEQKIIRSSDIAHSDAVLTSLQGAMHSTAQFEIAYLNTRMTFLSTVASTSPYIGLLGTVWGIINAFTSLTDNTQATLAQVAPGIAEALVATAMGLIAAIPAVIAYNYFDARINRLADSFDQFITNFSNILYRSF